MQQKCLFLLLYNSITKLENFLIMFNIITSPSKGRKQNVQGRTLSKESEENCRHRSTMAQGDALDWFCFAA